MDTGNFSERGALIASRIRTAAQATDGEIDLASQVAARIVCNQAYAVKQRWDQGDLSNEQRRGMAWALRAAVVTSGFAEEASANRELATIQSAVDFLVNTSTSEV